MWGHGGGMCCSTFMLKSYIEPGSTYKNQIDPHRASITIIPWHFDFRLLRLLPLIWMPYSRIPVRTPFSSRSHGISKRPLHHPAYLLMLEITRHNIPASYKVCSESYTIWLVSHCYLPEVASCRALKYLTIPSPCRVVGYSNLNLYHP